MFPLTWRTHTLLGGNEEGAITGTLPSFAFLAPFVCDWEGVDLRLVHGLLPVPPGLLEFVILDN